MNAEVRAKLAMGARVREFCRAHPSDDSSHVNLQARLEDRLGRADALAAQERAGRIEERAAADRRWVLRRAMQRKFLRHVIRVGRAAAKQQPDLAGKFVTRDRNANHKDFLVAAKAMLAEAVANKELFVRLGLSPVMLNELAKAVAEFEAVTASGNAGRADHIGARADLSAIAAEVVNIVATLNPFQLYRFETDPELLAAWSSAQEVVGPRRVRSPAPPTGDEPSPPAGQSGAAA
jgi:hypothetical protein